MVLGNLFTLKCMLDVDSNLVKEHMYAASELVGKFDFISDDVKKILIIHKKQHFWDLPPPALSICFLNGGDFKSSETLSMTYQGCGEMFEGDFTTVHRHGERGPLSA